MNRRTFLAGTTVALSLSAGCVGGNSGSSETTTTANSTTTPSETITGTPTATKAETTEVVTDTTEVGTTGTSSALPRECKNAVQFSELSSTSQKEFRMALNEEGLIRDEYGGFRIRDELPRINDEVGYETCVIFEEDPYYPIFGPAGGSEEEWKLTYQLAGSMIEAENRTGETDTVTATSDVENTSPPEEETQQNSGLTCGSNFMEFYGLSAPFADNVWSPSSVSVAFDLGAGEQVELAVLEGDTVLGTKRVEAPADTGFTSDGDIIPLNTELSGEHTIQVVMYPATGEGNQVSPEQATPCQYEGEPVQTEPRTIDFSRFSKNSKTTTHQQ